MSGGFELGVIGSSAASASLLKKKINLCVCMLVSFLRGNTSLLLPSIASMRLRPKRTCSGVVECFGGFHIKKIFLPFLVLERALYLIRLHLLSYLLLFLLPSITVLFNLLREFC